MKDYLVLIGNEPFTKVQAFSVEDALNYVNSRYSFKDLKDYIVVTPI